MSKELAIEVKDLVRKYGEKSAVDGISFDTKRGEVYGFLGPNGAGKTTTIKVLTTLLRPTSGSATVLGYDVHSQGKSIRERIGVVQQGDSFDQGLKVGTSMDIYGLIWNVPKEVRRKRIEELAERFDMKSFMRTQCIDLSAGQRRRLQVAREFVHDMDLLFLDEPTIGLDAIVRRQVLDFFKEKVSEGMTIFFTTHILEEAEYLCDRIGVINGGKIIAEDTPQNLKRRFGRTKAVEFKLLQGTSPELSEALGSYAEISKISQDETGTYRATTSKPETVIPEIYRVAERLGLTVSSIYIAETTLEDAFISLVTDGGKER